MTKGINYILLKPSLLAGLGDSILSLLQALAYAKLSGRTLCVDWTGGMYGMPSDINLFGRIFRINEIPYVSTIPDTRSVYPLKWVDATHKTFEQLRSEHNFTEWDTNYAIENYSFDVCKFDYTQKILVMWDFQQFGRLIQFLVSDGIIEEGNSVHKARGAIFKTFVSLTGEPRNYIEENFEKLKWGGDQDKIIGVHVRDTKESVDSFGLVSLKRYLEAVDALIERDSKANLIFLSTDNKKVQREFISRYSNKVLFNNKWFKAPGEPLHLSLEKCPDKWQNILDALFDMFVLSKCDYLIRRNASSFSTVSQAVGMIEDDNVISFVFEPSTGKRIINKLSVIKHRIFNYLNFFGYHK